MINTCKGNHSLQVKQPTKVKHSTDEWAEGEEATSNETAVSVGTIEPNI